MSNKETTPNVQASDNSNAVGSISAGGDISGNIHIGNVGYSPDDVTILLTQISSTFQVKPFDGTCPYKGLDVFEEEDTELFFGRETLVDELVRRVKESRTVFITGPSGSGKSSLVRAGLIPALKQGQVKGSERWLYATIKPGRDPFEALAVAFSRLKSPDLGKYFRDHSQEATVLNECVESVLSERKDQRLVLFIDQFEEVFTQISKEEERIVLLDLLTQAADAEDGRLILLFSMRSDFVPNCAVYSKLNTTLNRQFIQIGAMQPDELVSAIAQPALRVGLRIDPDLIAQIINDMKGEPGALPLMSFALKDLFDSLQEKGSIHALTLNDYLQRGGIQKSLERHADAAFANLNEHEKELTCSIFSGLIEIGRGTQDTKRTAIFDELIPSNARSDEVEGIVQKLADARLITTNESAGKDTVTISHEKLIDAWPWLKKLVNENRDTIQLRNEIASAAKEWEENKHDASYLYSGGRLANIWEQVQKQKLSLGQLAQEFIKAGRRKQQRTRAALISAISLVLIASMIASLAFRNQATEAKKQANISLARQLASEAQSSYIISNSKQLTASLLAIESLNLYPNAEASSFLINNNYSVPIISPMSHDNYVYSVTISPDGKYVASGSYDSTARVWDATTGKELARIPHDDSVNIVAFSPDGKYVVSGSYDNTARVWDASTGKELTRMTHDDSVFAVAFSPDGNYVASGSYDNTARVWDASTGKELTRTTHDNSVISIAFSPDGKYVVSGSDDNTARVWDASTGKELTRTTHDNSLISVAFSPDGKYVISGSWDGTARVWEAITGKELARIIHDDSVISVAFSPDGKYVISGSYDNTARVWDASTGKELARMTHDNGVTIVAFSPDGKYVISGSYDNTARVWESATGKELARMTHDGVVSSVAFSPDGKYVTSGSNDGNIYVWEPFVVKKLSYGNALNSIAFSPDGKYAVSGSEDNTVRVWDALTGKELTQMTHDDVVNSVAFSPDGKYAVSGSKDNTARVWDTTTGKELARMTHDGNVQSVAFSSDGKYVVSAGGYDGTVRVWDANTGKELARMTHDSGVSSVAFSPDGKLVVSGSLDNTARVWESATGKEIARMTHDDVVYSVVFNPDGNYVVSGSLDGTVRVWMVGAGKEIARMTNNGTVALFNAFSSDGKYVVSVISDSTIRIWEASTGKELARIIHDDIFVSFSSDEKDIISIGSDGIVHNWKWETEDLITDACSRVSRNLTRAEWTQYIGDALPYQAVCPNLPIEDEEPRTPTATP